MAKNYYGISDTGRVRDNNEDTFIAEKVLNNRFILACVIDGVGGYAGGEVAARIARESILKNFTTTPRDLIERMKQALVAVNENIHAEKKIDKKLDHMACVLTMALIDIESNKFYYAHVGDTRLYLLRDSSLVKITKDHSFVGFLEDSGRLTETQAMNHPKRNEINRALGFDSQTGSQDDYIDTGESPFLPGDMILICSDGLTDMVNNSEITAILTSNKSLTEKGKELIDVANSKGGKDNITVALVHHHLPRKEHKAIQPAALKKNESPEQEIFKNEFKADTRESANVTNKRTARKKPQTIVSIICAVLLLALFWWLFKEPKETVVVKPANKETEKPTVAKELSQQEQQLISKLGNTTSDTLNLDDSTFQQSILLAHTITISQDTIYIKGNGRIFTADASFSGPAIALSPGAKQVVLDSITLQNFDVGMLVYNKALRLKNVRFKNCGIAVQSYTMFSDSTMVSGFFKDSFSLIADTLPE